MTNKRKWLLLGTLVVAWGTVTFFQMSDSTQTDPMAQSANSGSPLPPIKALELEKTFPSLRQTAKFSTPRNIFAPLGMQDLLVQEDTKMASTTRSTEVTPPAPPPPQFHQVPPLKNSQGSGHANNSTNSNFWGI